MEVLRSSLRRHLGETVDGVANCSPFSQATHSAHAPPTERGPAYVSFTFS